MFLGELEYRNIHKKGASLMRLGAQSRVDLVVTRKLQGNSKRGTAYACACTIRGTRVHAVRGMRGGILYERKASKNYGDNTMLSGGARRRCRYVPTWEPGWRTLADCQLKKMQEEETELVCLA